jgi:hypothetical protein
MANEKISAFAAASALTGTEELGGVQSAANAKITPAQIKAYCNTYVTLPGGFQYPKLNPQGLVANAAYTAVNGQTLATNADEFQIIGRIVWSSGAGTKTVSNGTTGSASQIQFKTATVVTGSGGNVRIGFKAAGDIDLTAGPPARATPGSAAFDVYRDVTYASLSSNTWTTATMNTGTEFTVNNGDMICVSFYSDTPAGGASLITSQTSINANGFNSLICTQITSSGTVFTAGNQCANIVITLSDGTIAWIDGSYVASASNGAQAVGNGVIYANRFSLPFSCYVDAIFVYAGTSSTTNYDVSLYDSSATPNALVTLNQDINTVNTTGTRPYFFTFPTAQLLTKNTVYYAGVKQNSATAVNITTYDVAANTHYVINGGDAEIYAVTNSGSSWAQVSTDLRRAGIGLRIKQIISG